MTLWRVIGVSSKPGKWPLECLCVCLCGLGCLCLLHAFLLVDLVVVSVVSV